MFILHKNIRCDPFSEPSHRDGSYEGPQHMVSMKNKKHYPEILPLTWSSAPVKKTTESTNNIDPDEAAHCDKLFVEFSGYE